MISRSRTVVSAVVVAGGLVALAVSQGYGRPFGQTVADQPMAAVRAASGETVLLGVPGPREAAALRQAVASGEALTPSAPRSVRLSAAGPQATATSLHPVAFLDPASGERLSVDFVALESGAGSELFAPVEGYGVQRHPRDAALFLVERNSTLFLIDTRTGQAEALADPEARTLALRQQEADEALAIARDAQQEHHLLWAVEARWSLDGRSVAYLTNRDTAALGPAATSIRVLDLESGRDVELLRDAKGGTAVPQGFTARGEVLVARYSYASPDVRLVAVDVRGGAERALVPGRYVGQSADGRTLVWLRQVGDVTELRALDLARGVDQGVILREDAAARLRLRTPQVAISADGRRVAVDVKDGDSLKVLVHDLAGQPARLISLPAGSTLAQPLAWAGERLVVALENDARGSAQTALVDVQ